jgi:lysophospholipase L1-like esterase/tetratricopeptide (TPR) repeat protein
VISSPPVNRTRRIVARLVLGAAALAAALAGAELLLRAAGVEGAPDAQLLRLPGADGAVEPFTRRDELLIYGLVPLSRTFEWYAIDAHGYRTPPFSDEKPPGVFRVITTGDSCTFGLSTLETQHWSAVLRRALQGLCGDLRPVEVVDAGITGYSTLQNRLQVERDLLRLQPDLLVWLVTGANDTSLVEGLGDAEQSEALRSPLRALARLRVARLLGLGRFGWRGLSPNAEPGSTTARPRVTLDEAVDNLRAVAGWLPGRLLVGLYPPLPVYAQAPAVAELFARALATSDALGLPVVDLRPAVDAVAPLPIYIDNVHPSPVGHALIARGLLPRVLAAIELPAEWRAWIEAWQAARAGELERRAETLSGPGAPPRFVELAALYREPDLDARIERRDATLPAAVLEHDPLLGRSCRALSSARLTLGLDGTGPSAEARRLELERCVRPADPLLQAFGDEAALAAAAPARLGLARALLVYTAELGLVPARGDIRRGEAARAESADEAAALLAAAIALDPDDAAPRYERALALRRAGRSAEAREEWTRLAALEASGPSAALVEFARGLLAFEDGRLDESEAALRRALAAQFSLGYARTLLGRICLAQDRLDEAAREFALAAGMIGAKDQLPALMAQIEARRVELAGR